MAFAPTLITLDDPESDHRDHARKARAGAKNDPFSLRTWAPTSTVKQS